MMRTNEPPVNKRILPWVLLILASVGMGSRIWRGERRVAKPDYPLVAGHDIGSLLSNHVYGISGVFCRKIPIGDSCSTIKPTLLRGLFNRLRDE
jgi:hypothetical protein